MTSPEDLEGGQAFPVPAGFMSRDGDIWEPSLGMTLRDYFAAAALPLFANDRDMKPEEMAEFAFRLADAMLKERHRTR